MRRALIISPYFAPTNAADTHRIRISLPYFKELDWNTEIVSVDPVYCDALKDELLNESIPDHITKHLIKALSKKWTGKFGLGSIALRSMWFYYRKVNNLLKENKYDLIYFSTTQFPVCILGAYWKRRFGIPYVIDMQDPWHSEYYQDKPEDQRPSKYWFSYRLNKWLEPLAMKDVSGLISVSHAYVDDLKNRYPGLADVPSSVITFSASKIDFKIAEKNAYKIKSFVKQQVGRINIVYVGRGGHDMMKSNKLLFMALRKGLVSQPDLFNKFHIFFIGTSYAPNGNGSKSVQPLANDFGLLDHVTEISDRIGFYESIYTLQNSDILFIPGSDDQKYTASKIYPYLMSGKPILAIFEEMSSSVTIIKTCNPSSRVITFPGDEKVLIQNVYDQLYKWSTEEIKPPIMNRNALNEYSAAMMAAKQTALFDQVIAITENLRNSLSK